MIKFEKIILIVTSIVLGAALITGAYFLYTRSHNAAIGRGPVFTAVLNTLARGGPVKDDLIQRGLFIVSDSGTEGTIKFDEIEKLVNAKVYVVDGNNLLQFGPAYTPPDNKQSRVSHYPRPG
jgi:asparagine N-glycosylation enzyme membrane subunit Stt3